MTLEALLCHTVLKPLTQHIASPFLLNCVAFPLDGISVGSVGV